MVHITESVSSEYSKRYFCKTIFSLSFEIEIGLLYYFYFFFNLFIFFFEVLWPSQTIRVMSSAVSYLFILFIDIFFLIWSFMAQPTQLRTCSTSQFT